jgi:hypothetical protein
MEGQMKVVLSYMSEDFTAVKAMYDNLRANGLDVWIDKESIDPGTRWANHFPQALKNADVVISFYSSNARNRTPGVFLDEQALIDTEMRARRIRKLSFFPVRLNQCAFPDLKYKGQPLRDLHCLDLFGPDVASRYRSFFKFFGIAQPKIPKPPASKVVLRSARRNIPFDNVVRGVQVALSSRASPVYLQFGTTHTEEAPAGKLTLQAFVDVDTHSPGQEFSCEAFAKSKPLPIELEPFATRVFEISVIKYVTTNTIAESYLFKWALREIGVLPKYSDKSTWPETLSIEEID